MMLNKPVVSTIHDSHFVLISLSCGNTKSIYLTLPSESLYRQVNVEICERRMIYHLIGHRGRVIGFGVTKASPLSAIHLVEQLS
jgi:hypothetical protein